MDPIQPARKSLRYEWIVVLFASAVFLTGVISPPWLMDNVDATQAVMARNILLTGDWVSFRCDGVLYLEKAPLKYWMTAVSYLIFGEHDWVARLPIALSTIALCWLAVRMGRWAISPEAGFYSGLFLSTCIGLYLFTRTTIPDVVLTLSIAMSLYGFLRALDAEERRPRAWAYLLWAGLAAGVLLKGLIGLLFPVGAAVTYLAFSRQLFDRQAWRRLYPLTGFLIFFAIASPWHVLAILRNPPYFDFSLHSGPGQYRGFFWFYFVNEHLLRFLNLRYPRDYNTVPRVYFWLLNLAWLFPWSVYLPKVARLSYRPASREGRMHLLALCWIGFVMVFFTFSTTQEYYSMPIYPALALLLGSGVASADGEVRGGARIVGAIAACGAVILISLFIAVRNVAAPGDISEALNRNATPGAYSLALNHIRDLTVSAMAYLKGPLVISGFACTVGAIGAWSRNGRRAVLAIAVMMVLFLAAARQALVAFDPYLSSHAIAEALNGAPKGKLIVYGEHNDISSLFFYSEDHALLLHGRRVTLEYGSNAPGAPPVFINDDDFARLWSMPERYYLAIGDNALPVVEKIVPGSRLHLIKESGGKSLFDNQERASGDPR